MNLQANESLGVGLELFLVHEVGHLVAVDPSLDAGAFGENAVLVPFPVFEMLVRLELVLGSHPSATGFAVDIAGFGSVSFGRFDLDLRTVDSTELVPSFLFLVVEFLGLRSNLDTGVKFVVNQFDLELKLEVPVELVRTKKGIRASLIGGSQNGSVFNDVSRGSVLLGPSVECLAVKDRLEFSGLVVLGVEE